MEFNATFNNISVINIMVVSFIGRGKRNTRRKQSSTASPWQILSHKVVSSTPRHEQDSNSQL